MYALSDDPAKCIEWVTEKLLEQATSETGKAAVEECEEETEDRSDATREVTLSEIDVEGSVASANFAFVGGPLDGQTVALSVAKEGDRWKVDQIDRIVEFDRARLIAALEAGTHDEEEDEDYDPSQADCVLEELRRATREDLEGVVLRTSTVALVALVRECPKPVAGATEERKIEATISRLLTGKDAALCLEQATPRFLERATARKGLAAVEACNLEAQRHVGPTNLVVVSDIEVDGSRATGNAEIFTIGHGLRGQVVTFGLVEERGHWKVDRYAGFAEIDKDALLTVMVESLEAVGVPLTRRTANCLRGVLDDLPRPVLESVMLYPDPSRGQRLFGHCIGDAPVEQPRTL